VDGITKTLATLLLSLGAFAFGVHLGSQISRPKTVRFMQAIYRRSFIALSILTYAASFLTYFLLPAIYRHQVTAALLFSYPGTLTRYMLSIKLNSRLTGFPLGTFVANVFGTAVLGALHVVQNNPHAISPTACSLIQGLADGYCGCLTTVSTFAGEVLAFKDRQAWRYVLASWTASQIVLVIILQPSFHAGIAKTPKCIFNY
jgi:CrcB protein